jgi:hypothetical protein
MQVVVVVVVVVVVGGVAVVVADFVLLQSWGGRWHSLRQSGSVADTAVSDAIFLFLLLVLLLFLHTLTFICIYPFFVSIGGVRRVGATRDSARVLCNSLRFTNSLE